jgi:DNA mismatch endonuclease (patch repair protein)
MPGFKRPLEARSLNMAAIKSVDTKPELYVRRALHRDGFRFRLHRADLPGKPDIVLSRFSTVVFVHGCYWHGHRCKRDHLPQTNKAYWSSKIQVNIARDIRNTQLLEEKGWRVAKVWECTVKADAAQLIDMLSTERAKQTQRGHR